MWILFILNFHFPSLYIFLSIAMLYSASCPTPLSSSHLGIKAAKSSSCDWKNWAGRGRMKWSWLAVWIHHSRGLVSFSLQLLYRLYWERWHGRDLTQADIKHTLTNWSKSIWISFSLERHSWCQDLKPLVVFIQFHFFSCTIIGMPSAPYFIKSFSFAILQNLVKPHFFKKFL